MAKRSRRNGKPALALDALVRSSGTGPKRYPRAGVHDNRIKFPVRGEGKRRAIDEGRER